ncbi:sulfite exporter TauE/SafE family protein [Polaromonas sp. P2-4]|nr:sulfite exporter TauE/SafE family protein [Polaromonas sp. P2-4]
MSPPLIIDWHFYAVAIPAVLLLGISKSGFGAGFGSLAVPVGFLFVINLSKWIPYAWLGLLDLRNMATSLVLLPLAPVGVWMGVRMARRISPVWFYRVLYIGMLLTGIKLLWDATR